MPAVRVLVLLILVFGLLISFWYNRVVEKVVVQAQVVEEATGGGGGGANDDMVAGKVICNVISFVRAIGLPIMTGVILGSSIMAIFGRLAWPAIAILVVFTGVFFGADKLVKKFADGVGPTSVFSCT
ncbi:TrbC/VirB2 family protein [Anaplasma marginale]|uniref:TrbC/VirB2 family protein n=1 Tax=Anaplasma marginale TaxID=770 RepID=UPI00384CC89A